MKPIFVIFPTANLQNHTSTSMNTLFTPFCSIKNIGSILCSMSQNTAVEMLQDDNILATSSDGTWTAICKRDPDNERGFCVIVRRRQHKHTTEPTHIESVGSGSGSGSGSVRPHVIPTKRMIERSQWQKFGAAATDSSVVPILGELVFIEQAHEDIDLCIEPKIHRSAIRCRKCGGAHWTHTCASASASASASTRTGKYVPPAKRLDHRPANNRMFIIGQFDTENVTDLKNIISDAFLELYPRRYLPKFNLRTTENGILIFCGDPVPENELICNKLIAHFSSMDYAYNGLIIRLESGKIKK